MKLHVFGFVLAASVIWRILAIFLILVFFLFDMGCGISSSITPSPTPTSNQTPTITPTSETTQTNGWESNVKDWVEIFGGAITALAIIVGGWWSYNKFIKHRLNYPRGQITHTITHTRLINEKIFLHVTVNINNTGDVLLSLESAETWIQQVLPLTKIIKEKIIRGIDPVPNNKLEIEWPLLGSRNKMPESGLEIEPGENDWISYDFVIDKKMKVVRVYSFLQNKRKRGRNIGWTKESYYHLNKPDIK